MRLVTLVEGTEGGRVETGRSGSVWLRDGPRCPLALSPISPPERAPSLSRARTLEHRRGQAESSGVGPRSGAGGQESTGAVPRAEMHNAWV